ncbi:MAG: hypothetical protein ACM3QU_15965 [Verrucomicrobiota bacterium]
MTEQELRALAAWLELPEDRDLTPAVRARLRGRPSRRRAFVVVLAAVLAAVAIAFAVPPARSAILRVFHLEGVRIEYVDRLPDVRTAPLDLGIPIRPGDAERTAGFRPLASALLGVPNEVTWDGSFLWYRYGRTRLLVSQFRGRERLELVKKVVEPQTMITPVYVNGEPGYFITGGKHFLYVAPGGTVREEPVRLSRQVILWQHGPLTLRLEGDLTLAQALRIARSFR